jgi:hypothetical protein
MNALIMSRSKMGKTYALNTLPKPLIIQSTDPGGWTTICKKDQVAEPGDWDTIYNILERDGICAVDYLKSSNTISAGHIASAGYMRYQIGMTQFVNDCNHIINPKNDKIKSFSQDTLTGLSRMMKGFICSKSGKMYLSQQLWGDAIEKILEIIECCCASNKNYVLNCHIQLEQNILDGGTEEFPLIFGKQLPQNILALFDIVFGGAYEDGKYWWRTHPSEFNKSLGSRLHNAEELDTLIPQDFNLLWKEV